MKVIVKGKEYELDDLHIIGNSAEESEVTASILMTDDFVTYYTSADKYFTKIKKNIAANSKDWKLTELYFMPDGRLSGIRAIGPLNSFSMRAGGEREISDEQRQALAERLKAARNK